LPTDIADRYCRQIEPANRASDIANTYRRILPTDIAEYCQHLLPTDIADK
jgi:hypothetical protein